MRIRRSLLLCAGSLVLLPAAASAATPVATTLPATNVATGSATLNARVDPTSSDSTEQFEYGLTTAYGEYTTPEAIGAGAQRVNADVTGLLPGTTYHFRVVVVQNSYEGTFTAGKDLTFHTTGQSPPPPAPNGSGPGVSGTAQVGQTLTETHGSWSGSPTAYDYQWESCNVSGTACAAIAGATGQAYVLTPSDAGSRVRVAESAVNSGGTSAPVESPITAVVVPAAPAASAPSPSVSGNTTEGQTLTATHGGWSQVPTSYGEQWERCDASGAGCAAITGATGLTYTLGAADIGATIRFAETATNAGGTSAPASSDATGVVAAAGTDDVAPVDNTLPQVTGTVQVGDALTATSGAWTGTAPIAFTYAWERCTPGCTLIAGATSSTYILTAADAGTMVRAVVNAANASGTATAFSPDAGPVAVAGAGTTSPGTTPTGTGTTGTVITRGALRALLSRVVVPRQSATAIRRAGAANLVFAAPGPGLLSITWTAHRHGHMARIAAATVVFRGAEQSTVSVGLTAAGRKALGHKGRLKLTATARFISAQGAAARVTRRFTLRVR